MGGDSVVLMHLLNSLDNILGFKIENKLRSKKKIPLLQHKGTNSHLQR